MFQSFLVNLQAFVIIQDLALDVCLWEDISLILALGICIDSLESFKLLIVHLMLLGEFDDNPMSLTITILSEIVSSIDLAEGPLGQLVLDLESTIQDGVQKDLHLWDLSVLFR